MPLTLLEPTAANQLSIGTAPSVPSSSTSSRDCVSISVTDSDCVQSIDEITQSAAAKVRFAPELGHGAGVVRGAAFRRSRGTCEGGAKSQTHGKTRGFAVRRRARAGRREGAELHSQPKTKSTQKCAYSGVPVAVEVVRPEDVLRPLLAPGSTVVRLAILRARVDSRGTHSEQAAVMTGGAGRCWRIRTMATTPSRNSW